MKHTTRASLSTVLVTAAVLLMAPPVTAQSLDAPSRQNALTFTGGSAFNDTGFVRGDAGFAFGFAGYLDVGFGVVTILDELESTDAQEMRLTFSMRGLVARQQDGFPLTLALAIRYYFAQVNSNYLDNAFPGFDLLRSGRGYAIGPEIRRDFFLAPRVSLRSGIAGGYAVDRYTTTLSSGFDATTDPAGLAAYPVEDLTTGLTYSATLGPVITSKNGRGITSILLVFRGNQNFDLSGALELGFTLLR